jgi:hypothetical protein
VRQFTRLVARLGAVVAALGILAGCAARTAREGVLLVSWMTPTTNTDGSPLSDLASYRIYIDTKGFPCPGGPFVDVDATKVSRTADGRVSVILSNVIVGQAYHVAVAAITSHGVQSECSDTAGALARPPDKK